VIPEAVYKECIVEGGNREEVKFLKETNWIEVKQIKDKKLIKLLESHLDYGESEAIALALEIDADIIYGLWSMK
jgi:predicted nucleic acid-binding protein